MVLLTGQGSETLAGEAIGAGITDYYTKGNGAEGVHEVVAAVEQHARRHRRERELERARRRYALVADVVTDAVFEWEPEHGAVAIEDERALGYDTAEGPFDESWWFERVHPDDREALVTAVERAREHGDRRFTDEYRFRRADGEYADVRVTSRFVYEDGETVYAVGALRDVSEWKARERELERQNERLDRFASVVSHDLRNPLAVAQGYLQLAEETGDPDHFERTAGALDRIGELVDDLLELARTGRGVGEVGPVLLSGVATEAWENVETGDARLGLPDDVTVQADRARLRQLLENLFRNSMEHGTDGTDDRLTVSLGPLDDRAGFYVADDGVGIPEGMRDRLFETGVTGSDDGTGFGLAIVREIAESHGWEAAATNGEDGGARFEFTGVALD